MTREGFFKNDMTNEELIERAVRLRESKNVTLPADIVREAGLINLRKLHDWACYTEGARMMLLHLREYFLCEEPHPGDARKITAEDKIINKAILDLIMSSKENIDRFLMEQYKIRLTDHEKDKKGKLVKCRAFFAKKVVKYEEIKSRARSTCCESSRESRE